MRRLILSGVASWLLNHISDLVRIILIGLLWLWLLLLLNNSVTCSTGSACSMMSRVLLVNLLSWSFI